MNWRDGRVSGTSQATVFVLYLYLFHFFQFRRFSGGIRQQLPLVKQKPATEVNSEKCCILITLLRAVITIMPSVCREISSQFLNEVRRCWFTIRNGRWLYEIYHCECTASTHHKNNAATTCVVFHLPVRWSSFTFPLYHLSPSSSSLLSIALVSTTNALSFCRQFICGSLQQSYMGRASIDWNPKSS